MIERLKQGILTVASFAVIISSQSFGDYWKQAIAPQIPKLPIKSMSQGVASNNDFDKAYQVIRRVEGGYSNHPNDRGGATYKGITAAVAKRWGIDDPKKLTEEQIKKIYLEDYWKRSGADKQPWPLNLAIFNSYVNSGKKWQIPEQGTPKEKAIAYLDQQTAYYHQIVENNSSQKVFLRGWLNRSRTVKEAIQK